MRRKVGVSVVKGKKEELAQFSKVGKAMEDTKLSFVQETLSSFRSTLAEFATKHRDRINSDPEFRQQFHRMCLSTGVDPLASSKGFWADILGVGDFYFELGVKVIQVAVQTRSINGGIMPLNDMLVRIQQKMEGKQRVSSEDILRAVDKISILGSGFRLLKLGGSTLIISVPLEVTNDHEQLLYAAEQEGGMVNEERMRKDYSWTKERFAIIIRSLITDGIVWIDGYNGSVSYYFPSLFRFDRA
jgi:ESCRT-II complex subunit VPS22